MRDRVAIVTGAGSGMGRAIALRLADEGIAVALVGRRGEPLHELAREIETRGGRSLAVSADIARPEAAQTIVDQVVTTFGPIDILVNNAGSASEVLDPRWMRDEQWEDVLNVNLSAVFRLVRAVLPSMLERKTGTIVAVSSLAALTPNLLGGAAYGAAKAGVRNLMTFLHTTYRNDGVRSITVLPGEANTPILDNRAQPPSAEAREVMVQPEDVAAAVHLAVTTPQRTVLQEIVVAPTRQRDVSDDLARSRVQGAPDHDDSREANA